MFLVYLQTGLSWLAITYRKVIFTGAEERYNKVFVNFRRYFPLFEPQQPKRL